MVWILICTVHCKFIWSFLAFPRTCNGQVIWLTLSLPKLIISNFPCSFTRHIHYNRLYEQLILTNLYCTFELFKGWVNVLFELWSEMVNAQYIVQCDDRRFGFHFQHKTFPTLELLVEFFIQSQKKEIQLRPYVPEESVGEGFLNHHLFMGQFNANPACRLSRGRSVCRALGDK